MLDHTSIKLFISGKPVASTIALMKGEFRLAGEIIAMSVLQGGPAPCFFGEEVVKYLTKQPLLCEKNNGAYKTICEKVSSLVYCTVVCFLFYLQYTVCDVWVLTIVLPFLQLMGAVDDEKVREILISDEGMEILQEIGYKGVPHRETKSSICSIIQ
jgi:hypothetical protein